MGTPKKTGKGKRVFVSFGKLSVKTATGKEQRNFVLRVVERVQEALNMKIATKEELRGEIIKGTQTKSRLKGCKGSKSVIVEDPKDPAKGKKAGTLSFPVPSQANIDDIGEFLAKNTNAKRFRLGGGWYDVESFK